MCTFIFQWDSTNPLVDCHPAGLAIMEQLFCVKEQTYVTAEELVVAVAPKLVSKVPCFRAKC